MYEQVMHKRAFPERVTVNLVRRFDPLAVGPLVRDRMFYYVFKRAFDVTVAGVMLLILAPVMVVVAFLILLDSGWPIIFCQERVGAERWTRDGFCYWRRTTFTCYKFRSMVRNADPKLHEAFVKAFVCNDQEQMAAIQEENSEVRKLVNDPRVTRMGKFLRKTSLDELPQLWNVLTGDMSLVGPRPDVPYAVDEYTFSHQQRLAAQPGLSGLWQVMGRCQIDFDDMVRMDVEYIDNQSLLLDLKILLLTIPAVLSGHGAV